MSILETLVIAFLAFFAFCALIEAVKQVLVARSTPPACPSRDLHSVTLTLGSVFELQPGTVIPPTTGAAVPGDWFAMTDKKAAAAAAMWRVEADLHTTFSTEGVEEVASSFQDIRDARDIERAKSLLASDEESKRLQGEIFMLRLNLRRVRRGLPSLAFA